MAAKTKNRKRKPAAPKKQQPAAKKGSLLDIRLLTTNPKVKELIDKDPDFRAKFEKAKAGIIAGHGMIKSPEHAYKILKCKKTELVVLIQVQPSDRRSIHKEAAAVIVSTMCGRIQYGETIEFKNLKRACEYVQDVDQLQIERFTSETVKRHAHDIANSVISELKPIVDKAISNGMQREASDNKREDKK